jgi:large subunit ribosomal protein L10
LAQAQKKSTRENKAKVVNALNEVFRAARVVVVAHNTGLTVAEMGVLRGRLREAGARMRVTKNRLAKRALDGAPCAGIASLFEGPTAIAWSEDPVAAPKVFARFAKENDKLVIRGGALGARVLDPAAVTALAALPSLDELRARLVGLLTAPQAKLARLLNAPAGGLARVIAAYAEKAKDAA